VVPSSHTNVTDAGTLESNNAGAIVFMPLENSEDELLTCAANDLANATAD
jgi:hypothetical protein